MCKMSNNLQRNYDKLKKSVKQYEEALGNMDKRKAHATKYAMMLVDPSGHLARAPAYGAPRGATRHFTRTFTLNSTGANSQFGFKLTPSINDFFSSQVGETAVAVNGLVVTDGSSRVPSRRIVDATSQELIGVSSVSDGPREIRYVTTSTAPDSVKVTNTDDVEQTYNVFLFYGGGWILGGSVTVAPTLTESVTLTPALGAIGGVRIVPVRNHPYREVITDTLATSVTLDSLTRPLVRDEWLERGQVVKFRLSAMSVLASYRGNYLANAGVIAAARAPESWVPSEANMYSSICKLPEDRYKGPIMEGAYVWWLPGDEGELDFSPNGSGPERTSLYLGGEFGDADGSLEVTIDVVADFYSPLQIFERKYYPAISPEFYEALQEISSLPAATCNPKHLDLLKKGAGKLARGVVSGIDLAKRNPELVSAFMKALMGLATLA